MNDFPEVAPLAPAYTTDMLRYEPTPLPPDRSNVIPPSAQALNLSGIGVDDNGRGPAARPVLSNVPYESNIVVFYQHAKTGVIHFTSQSPGDWTTKVDRPARLEDKERYSRQWHNFVNSKEQVKLGTPLAQLYKQQPSLVNALEAKGVSTVEQLANLNDIGIEAIKEAGGVEAVHYANKHLEQRPIIERDEVIAKQAKEIEDLKRQLAEAQAQPKRRRATLD